MIVYILSTHEENGADEVEGTSNIDKLYDKVEAYLKARDISEENIFYAKNRVRRFLAAIAKGEADGNQGDNLTDVWGGPQLHVIELED